MDDQMSLHGFEPPHTPENQYINKLLPSLCSAVEAQNIDGGLITVYNGQSYTSVSLSNFTIFRLKLRGKKHYITIPSLFIDLVPSSLPQETLKSEGNYRRILITEENPIESDTVKNFLITIAQETVSRYPKEYDCCSRFLECSDHKSCIHPDKVLALSCGYRKILNSGRIFYGQNRNID
ncbi:MAG: hypothetical protein AAGU75_18635 [Bacillota bacterium]